MKKVQFFQVSTDTIDGKSPEGFTSITVSKGSSEVKAVYPNSCVSSTDFSLRQINSNKLLLSRFTSFTDWKVFEFTYDLNTDKWYMLSYITEYYTEENVNRNQQVMIISHDNLLLLISNLCEMNHRDSINNFRKNIIRNNLLTLRQKYERHLILLDTNIRICQNELDNVISANQNKLWHINRNLTEKEIDNINMRLENL